MDKLKPCPFCDNKDLYTPMYSGGGENDESWFVNCDPCKELTFGPFGSEEEAIKTWNHRPHQGIDFDKIRKCIESLELSQCGWEDGEDIVTINGEPIGATITRDSKEFHRWLPDYVARIIKELKLYESELLTYDGKVTP